MDSSGNAVMTTPVATRSSHNSSPLPTSNPNSNPNSVVNSASNSANRKPKFRSRKIDVHKPLAVYLAEQLPDLDDQASISRAMPAMPTGVDKDEEDEHHLQLVIQQQKFSEDGSRQAASTALLNIPTRAESIRKIEFYEQLYDFGNAKTNIASSNGSKGLIRFTRTIEDCLSVAYDVDEADVSFLQGIKSNSDNPLTEDQFEMLMNQLEREHPIANTSNVSSSEWLERLKEAFSGIPSLNSAVDQYGEAVIKHWQNKRLSLPAGITSLIGNNTLRHSSNANANSNSNASASASANSNGNTADSTINDAYVCFRKRETRVHRKTRRTDAQALERLKRLRLDLETAKTLLEMLCKRDQL